MFFQRHYGTDEKVNNNYQFVKGYRAISKVLHCHSMEKKWNSGKLSPAEDSIRTLTTHPGNPRTFQAVNVLDMDHLQ